MNLQELNCWLTAYTTAITRPTPDQWKIIRAAINSAIERIEQPTKKAQTNEWH